MLLNVCVKNFSFPLYEQKTSKKENTKKNFKKFKFLVIFDYYFDYIFDIILFQVHQTFRGSLIIYNFV